MALTSRQIETATKRGYYGDGGGLYLQISKYGTKSWVFRFQIAGRSREMGLGSLDTFSLREARRRARECRQLVADGVDPIETRRERRHKQASRLTFQQAAEQYITAHNSKWRSKGHRQRWSGSLRDYVFPTIGKLPIDAVDLHHVLRVLEPIWKEKTVTAMRVRGRIERVLAWSTVRKLRHGDNPARWNGHLAELFATKKEIKHFASVPFADVPGLLARLRNDSSIEARALEFTILTAARTSEATEARWSEINGGVWIVPAERMKGKREHRIPLSNSALDVLSQIPQAGDYVFTGIRGGKPLHRCAMLKLLGRMEISTTVHGFRSSFRDWAGECTDFPREVIEAALAHKLKDASEAAYRRGDALEKRRGLMEAWATYCCSTGNASSEVGAMHG
jgi:integrase